MRYIENSLKELFYIMTNKETLYELNALKGIAIIGVVIIHLPVQLVSMSPMSSLLSLINKFQSFMPVFIFVSGFLFGYSNTNINSIKNYYTFIQRKFKRLMVPYFVLSMIVLMLKYTGNKYFVLQHPVGIDFWKYLLFNPMRGFAAFLWFIYVLFIIFMIFPVMNKVIKNPWLLLLAILILYFYPTHQMYFELHLVKQYLIYFYVGVLFSHYKFNVTSIRTIYSSIVLFIAFVFLLLQAELVVDLMNNILNDDTSQRLYRLSFNLTGALSLYYLFLLSSIKKTYLFRMFSYLGIYSSSIYLLHTIVIGPVQLLMFQFLKINENMYLIIALLILLSGVFMPILIAKHFIGKRRLLCQLILGVNKYP